MPMRGCLCIKLGGTAGEFNSCPGSNLVTVGQEFFYCFFPTTKAKEVHEK